MVEGVIHRIVVRRILWVHAVAHAQHIAQVVRLFFHRIQEGELIKGGQAFQTNGPVGQQRGGGGNVDQHFTRAIGHTRHQLIESRRSQYIVQHLVQHHDNLVLRPYHGLGRCGVGVVVSMRTARVRGLQPWTASPSFTLKPSLTGPWNTPISTAVSISG